MFYFHWVDKEDNNWDEAFAVNDESVFAFNLDHAEGDFPSMEVDLKNPRVGLLSPSRKTWAWMSWRDPSGVLHPLFFGRLVGIPQALQEEIVRLTFIARPPDYEDQKEALASSLRVQPYYDPLWFSEEDRLDPDSVLEGRPALWHIDRVTHQVTISDLIIGEDGNFTPINAIYDSVSVSLNQSPVRRIDIEATVEWEQWGSGSMDITRLIRDAFAAQTPPNLTTVDGTVKSYENSVATVSGQSLIDNWPQAGQGIGGGWSVGVSGAVVVGDIPLPPSVVDDPMKTALQTYSSLPSAVALQRLFTKSAGFFANVTDYSDASWSFYPPIVGKAKFLWVPIWRIEPYLELAWEVRRSRKETVTFSVGADVQPLLTEPDDAEVLKMTFGPADVDGFINPKSSIFFRSDRGYRAFEYLLSRARSALLSRARAVNVSFDVAFEEAIGLSCRMNAFLSDPRLPGGQALGKVKGYSFALDGSSGELMATVTMACTVGRDGSVEAVPGQPTYVDEGYVETGYQDYVNNLEVPFNYDLGYTIGLTGWDDDGINLYNVSRSEYVLGVTLTGGLADQMAAANLGQTASSEYSVLDRINNAETSVSVELKPLTGGPFHSQFVPEVTELKVPRTINLET